MQTILLIEDDVSIIELVRYSLENEGYSVLVAGDGLKGLETATQVKPDLIVLDLMLPGLDGYEVCRALRTEAVTAAIPIIVLSARSEVIDKVLGIEFGADDYMTKPFSPRELLARVRARLREESRTRSQEVKPIVYGELELWPQGYYAKINGKQINLTVKEFDVLKMLAAHPHQVFSREHLLEQIWGDHVQGDTRTVDVHVSNLRSKLKPVREMIESVRGVGYRFVPPTQR